MLKRIAAAAACAILFFPTVIFAESSEPLPPVSPAGQESWIYLDENPAGPQSIVAYSLGGRDVKENARQMLDITLESGVKDGFTSALELEYSILGLIKLGENPSSYNRTDLMSMLYGYDNIFREGLESALYALISYDAANTQIPAIRRQLLSTMLFPHSSVPEALQSHPDASRMSKQPPRLYLHSRRISIFHMSTRRWTRRSHGFPPSKTRMEPFPYRQRLIAKQLHLC